MSDLTIRCRCGFYCRVTEIYANQAVEIVRAWVVHHQCNQEELTDD